MAVELINQLKGDYPQIKFSGGKSFCWSPSDQKVVYKTGSNTEADHWALLHEVAHALLGHKSFSSDFSLLKAEVDAWARARELAADYKLNIDDDYIDDCLDTYRDWLYKRSSCPRCREACLQMDGSNTYLCHNCNFSWRVSRERFCRVYRQHESSSPPITL